MIWSGYELENAARQKAEDTAKGVTRTLNPKALQKRAERQRQERKARIHGA